jgi:hypothetical protein
MLNEKTKEGITEVIIATQSVLMMALAIAGLLSTDAVTSAFKALTNAQSAMYIITDNAIVTETENISTERVQSIIQNYELINVSILAIGSIIFISTIIRLIKKTK